MSGKAEDPKSRDTEHADAAEEKPKTDVLKAPEDGFDLQDEDTYKILAMLNQEHLEDVFGDENAASEDEDSQEFSQAFMDGMRDMVAGRFGQEASERFMTLYNKTNHKGSHHQPKDVFEPEKAMSHADASAAEAETPASAEPSPQKKPAAFKSLFRNLFRSSMQRRIASILAIVILTAGLFQIGVFATKLPSVETQPQDMGEYSKVGSLQDIMSNLDVTSYPQELEQVYEPGIVAEGFEEVGREQVSRHLDVFYENESGKWYQYQQMTVSSSMFLDTEEGEWIDVLIGEYPGIITEKNNGRNLWWFDYQYTYHIEGDLTEEELKNIAESLCEFKE